MALLGPDTCCSWPRVEDPRSSFFWDLIHLVQWWYAHQPSLLGDSQDKVLEGRHYVCQHLSDPICVDVTVFDCYFHWPRCLWTNLAPLSTITTKFLQCLHLLMKKWMTSWIHTGPLCQLFGMIYPDWH